MAGVVTESENEHFSFTSLKKKKHSTILRKETGNRSNNQGIKRGMYHRYRGMYIQTTGNLTGD